MTTTSTKLNIIRHSPTTAYDYTNQAWITISADGTARYTDCNHPQAGQKTILGDIFDGCDCYGRAHANEMVEIN